MLRYLLLVLGLLGYASRLPAQTYEPGLLVRSSGDTLRGQLENDYWVAPPAFIRFRTAADAPSQLLRPRQLRAVCLQGGRYFRYEVLALDHAATTVGSQLQRGYAPRVQTDSLLAEVLLDGPVTLLRVAWPSSTHYVVRRPSQPDLELAERRYLRPQPGGGFNIVDANNYRNQLQLYFRDCPAAAAVAATAPYTAQGLAGVAQAYATTCTADRQPAASWVALAQPRRRGVVLGGVLGGLRYNRLENLSGTSNGSHTDGLVHPFGGFYAEVLQPGRHAAIYGELSLSSFRNEGLETFVSNLGTYSYQTFAYTGLLATARLGVRYLPPLPHEQQLIFGLGLEINQPLGLQLPPPTPGTSSRTPAANEQSFAYTTLLPNLTVGWRKNRLSVLLDGQVYASSHEGDTNLGNLLYGSNFALRLGTAYRLGRSPDQLR